MLRCVAKRPIPSGRDKLTPVQQALSNSSITDFVIIEYQDRLGGRMTQTDFGKKKDGSPYVVELGANWVRREMRSCDALVSLTR